MKTSATLRQLFHETNIAFQPLLKNSLGLIALLFLGCEAMQHYFALLIRLAQDTQSQNLPAILGQMVVSLTEFVALTMLIPLRVMEFDNKAPAGSFWAFTQKHLAALTLESLRSLAITLLWTLLFIIPGIFKYIRYLFVPYVVVADPVYQEGQRDALEYSDQLAKGIGLPLFVLLVILFGLEALHGSLIESFPLMENPIPALASGFVLFLVSLYANVLLFRIYQLRVKSLVARS